MAHEINHENDAFLWETQSWVNLSNDTADNSSGEKVVSVPAAEPTGERKRRRTAAMKGKGKEGEGPSEHEIHIWTERERRKKMRSMFATLHSLLPQLNAKADKTTIVEEAVNYVKTLQNTVERLEIQKIERNQGLPPMSTFPIGPPLPATSRLATLPTREAFMANQVSLMNNNNSNNNYNYSNGSSRPVKIKTWTASNVVLSICGNIAQYAVYATKKPVLFTTICSVLEKYEMEIFAANIYTDDANRSHFMFQTRATGDDQDPESIIVENMYRQAAIEIVFWTS
ncbi:transcription factor bHLH95-like [Chenopodium quinoa]|uniref:transcription factor bHLH95-like n=1 Tax=Chenopodium quinoa TaxID=63459 RepID=UPI000B7890B7|nr:transcription factor bHLH95-like [Chenopodium quinoa]